MTSRTTQTFHVIDIIGIAFLVAGLLFALGIGLSTMRRDRLTTWAVAAGLLVNVPAFLAGGGPGVFAGLILFPVIFILAAHLGRGIRWILVRLGLVAPEPRSGGRI
jgi:hypothetical protein